VRARAAFLVLTLAACSGTSATPPTGDAIARCDDLPDPFDVPLDGPASTDEEIARWQLDRAGFGLPSDEASTRAAAANPTPEAGQYPSTPITAAEFEEFRTRGLAAQRVVDQARTIVPDPAWAISMNYRIAGIDVATTADPADLQRRLDALVGVGHTVVRKVPFGPAELEGLQALITSYLDERDIAWGGIGAGSTLDRVQIGLTSLDPEVLDDLAATFPSEVDRLCVEERAPVVPA
jgi:hypothetical protein